MQRDVAVEPQVIGHAQVHVAERRRRDRHVLGHARTFHVLHEHLPRAGPGYVGRQAAQGLERRREVAIEVRRAEHPPHGRHLGVLAPLLGLRIAAPLPGHPGLQLEPAGEDRPSLDVHPGDRGSRTVVTLLDLAAVVRILDVAQGEYIVETRVEALDEQVRLHASEVMVEVGREAHAVRPLLFQVVGQPDPDPFSAHDGDVQVLVEGLRSPVAGGIAHPEVHRLRGVEAHVDPRAENHMVDQIVLVQTPAEQQRPLPGFPLVLEIAAHDVHLLVGVDGVTDRAVVEIVVAVLGAERQFRGHEEQPLEGVHVLQARRHDEIPGRTVGPQILLAAVIAFAGRVLERGVDVETVAAIGRREVERKAAAVDRVVGLFGHVGLVGRAVQQVAAPAVFVQVVVLRRDARVGSRAEVGAHAYRTAVEHGQFGKSVPVMIVARTVAALAEDPEPGPAALGDDRGVEHRGVVVGVAAAERHQRMRELRGAARRLFGDDVDRAADGRRAVERRAAAAQHLDPFDHVGRDLFQSVDPREGREDRMRIDQDLRIVAVEPVDADLGEAAVLAVVLDPHAGLEREPLGQTRSSGLFEQPGIEDTHQSRRLAPQRCRTARRDHHLIHRDAALLDLEVQFAGRTARQRNRSLLHGIAQGADLDGQRPFGEVFQIIVSRSVGRRPEGSSDHRDRGIRDVFMGCAVDDVSEEVGVGTLPRDLGALHAETGQAQRKQCRQKESFHGKIWVYGFDASDPAHRTVAAFAAERAPHVSYADGTRTGADAPAGESGINPEAEPAGNGSPHAACICNGWIRVAAPPASRHRTRVRGAAPTDRGKSNSCRPDRTRRRSPGPRCRGADRRSGRRNGRGLRGRYAPSGRRRPPAGQRAERLLQNVGSGGVSSSGTKVRKKRTATSDPCKKTWL